jgi:translation initiation factor 2 subunit 3
VDNPGHNAFMATMLNGNSVMNWAITVESSQTTTDTNLAPQTVEHLKAIKMANLKSPIICINKMDLQKGLNSKQLNFNNSLEIEKNKEYMQHKISQMKMSLKSTPAENALCIPISASMGINIDSLLCEIVKQPLPELNLTDNFEMPIIRSFNVNKPNSLVSKIVGGVIGGSIIKGLLNIGDNIIILPGFVTKNPKYIEPNKRTPETSENSEIKWMYRPLYTEVKSINSDNIKLNKAISGGLIGVMTTIDPSLVIDDGLIGNMALCDKAIKQYYVFEGIIIIYEPFDSNNKITKGSILSINSNGSNSKCTVMMYKEKQGKITIGLQLDSKPICAKINDYVTITSTDNDSTLRVLGKGIIQKGLSSILF